MKVKEKLDFDLLLLGRFSSPGDANWFLGATFNEEKETAWELWVHEGIKIQIERGGWV